MAFTFQIIGHKKSGKTLITEALTKKLVESGYDVCVFKHAHEAQMDVPGTDSARFSQAGARQVILTTPNGFFYHVKRTEPTLTELISFLPTEPDFILAEGYKDQDYEKLLLLKAGEKLSDFKDVTKISQVASINSKLDLELNSADKILAWAFDYLRKKL